MSVPKHDLGNIFATPQPFNLEKSKRWGLLAQPIEESKLKLRRGSRSPQNDDVLYVHLKDVVEALGGTYRYDPKLDTIVITVPSKPK